MGSNGSKQAKIFPHEVTFSKDKRREICSEAYQKRLKGGNLTEMEERLLQLNSIEHYVETRCNH